MVILFGLITSLATLAGGLFALRFKDQLHLILGFSAGAIIGVVFFDLLPEAIDLGGKNYGVDFITTIMAAGFIVFMILDRLVQVHPVSQEDDDGKDIGARWDDVGKSSVSVKTGKLWHGAHGVGEEPNEKDRGRLGAGSLTAHSFLDGLAIGLAFKVNSAAGFLVLAAVLMHDFSDGINTVNLILKNNGSRRQAFRWLLADAAAPVLGVLATFAFSVPEASLGLILAVFCGFFLHIGASDLLPESYHRHPAHWTTIMTVLGVIMLYLAVHLIQAA